MARLRPFVLTCPDSNRAAAERPELSSASSGPLRNDAGDELPNGSNCVTTTSSLLLQRVAARSTRFLIVSSGRMRCDGPRDDHRRWVPGLDPGGGQMLEEGE